MSRAALLALLDDIRVHVEAGDSFEGFLSYALPGPFHPDDVDFLVDARYRIGNRDGSQGGMRVVGELVDDGGRPHV